MCTEEFIRMFTVELYGLDSHYAWHTMPNSTQVYIHMLDHKIWKSKNKPSGNGQKKKKKKKHTHTKYDQSINWNNYVFQV